MAAEGHWFVPLVYLQDYEHEAAQLQHQDCNCCPDVEVEVVLACVVLGLDLDPEAEDSQQKQKNPEVDQQSVYGEVVGFLAVADLVGWLHNLLLSGILGIFGHGLLLLFCGFGSSSLLFLGHAAPEDDGEDNKNGQGNIAEIAVFQEKVGSLQHYQSFVEIQVIIQLKGLYLVVACWETETVHWTQGGVRHVQKAESEVGHLDRKTDLKADQLVAY